RFISSIVFTPPPTVNGTFTCSAVERTISTIVCLPSFVAEISRKVISSAPSLEYFAAISTGSPNSRKPTKFVPFTTLPSFTSKQGMIRLVIIFLCLYLHFFLDEIASHIPDHFVQ